MMQITKQNKLVIVLYLSTLIGVLFGVLTSVINTRALSPVQYGDVRYVQNIITFTSSLLLFGFFTSGSRLLALSKDEAYSRRIRGGMCIILGISVCVLMLVMTSFSVASYLKNNTNLTVLYIVSIPLCSNVLFLNYLNTTTQGDNHIVRLSLARVLPSAVYCLLAWLVFQYFGATPVKMIVLYNGIAIIILFGIIISTKPDFSKFRESLREIAKENKSYGLHIYVGSLFGVSTTYIAGITLGNFCADNANVGFYTLALSIASPIATLPTIIGTTYFKRFATENRITKRMWLVSVGLTVLSAALFIVFIGYIVDFLYDSSYFSVSKYASCLAIGMCFHGLGDMINRFLGAHGQGKQIRNAAVACGTVLIFGNIVLIYKWGINGAIITKILSSITYMLVLCFYYHKYHKYITR